MLCAISKANSFFFPVLAVPKLYRKKNRQMGAGSNDGIFCAYKSSNMATEDS